MPELIKDQQQAADDAAAAMIESLEAKADQIEAEAEQALGPAPKPTKTYTREDINKARQQEKDKLYPELQKLREQVQLLTQAQEAAEAEKKAQADQIAAEAKKREEEEMDVRSLLAKKEVEWQQRLDTERQEREHMAALFERERQFAQLQEYRTQAVNAAADDILPELLDLVSGNTPEEIDASINGLKARTERILGNVREASTQVRRESSGARVTAPPAADPLDNYSGQRTFTPEEIRAMSVDEYAQYRQSLLGGAASGRGQGMFG